MRRNLIRYLPDILKRNLDFRILMEVQENYGLQPLWDAAQTVFDDQFITTADEYGIARYESILGLKPDKDDTLEERRRAVLMAWRRKPHIGLPELQETADIWAPGWTELEYVHPLMIVVWMTENAPYGFVKHKAMWSELRKLAPANVDFDFAWRYLRVKEVHRQMSVAELERTPKKYFAGGTGIPDWFRGSGILRFGSCLVVRERSKITVKQTGDRLDISDSPTYRYEAPAYEQIGDGLWRIDGALTVAADSMVSARTEGDTLMILDKEE